MKRFLLFSFFILVYSAYSQWKILGYPNFSEDYPSTYTITSTVSHFISVDKYDIPYDIYTDHFCMSKATVKKFDGENWVAVGKRGFSSGYSRTPTIAFDSNNKLYATFWVDQNAGKPSVMTFEDTSWVFLGPETFTPKDGTYTFIAMDQHDIPYLAFRDMNQNYRASVMKFSGTTWEYVGPPGFSTPGSPAAGASNTSIYFDKNNTLYIAYMDMCSNYRATVQKFNGTEWEYVGNPGFAGWTADFNSVSMVFDSQNTPYIIGGQGGKAMVLKFDDEKWVAVGKAGFSEGFAEFASIAIDSYDTLFVAFKDWAHGQRSSVMKFNGTDWEYVGEPGFSAADVFYQTSAIDSKGNIYVAFSDGSTHHYRATVMVYERNITTSFKKDEELSFQLFPNPTDDLFTVQFENKKNETAFIKVTNTLGQIVLTKELSGDRIVIDMRTNERGLYFMELSCAGKKVNKKILLQ